MENFREYPIVTSYISRTHERYVLLFLCQKVAHRTHGMTQNWFHVFTRIYTEKFSRKGAKGAERYVLLFLCQKSCTQKYRTWPNKSASFFAYFENSVGAIESCLLGRGCGFVKPHPQKTTFNLERKNIMEGCALKYQYHLFEAITGGLLFLRKVFLA